MGTMWDDKVARSKERGDETKKPRRWIEVYPSGDQFGWRVRSANGQIVSVGGEQFVGAAYAEEIARDLHPNLDVRQVDS